MSTGMNRLSKGTALLLVAVLILSLAACTGSGQTDNDKVELETDVTVQLWYDDSRMTAYFEECANRYHDSNSHVTVKLNLVSEDDYLKNIYNSCIKDGNIADIFMMSSDDVREAYLMGLMSDNSLYPDIYTPDNYGNAAITACTYKDKLLGYPLTFENAVMVYNKKYASAMKTFEEITAFSDSFQHTEENAEVTQIIGWDVSDIELNYPFFGAYMNVGGDKADDKSKTTLQDDKLTECMNAFLTFKDIYGIVRNTYTYEDCLKQFQEGKLLYTIVSTDDLAAINSSGVNYGIMQIPDYNSTLKTRAVSSTDMLVVTPYSSNIRIAESVAKAFTYDYADCMYEKSRLVSARRGLSDNTGAEYENLYKIYSDTAVKARYMEIGDFYLQLEIVMHQIWDGTVSVNDGYTQFKNYVFQTQQTASQTAGNQ